MLCYTCCDLGNIADLSKQLEIRVYNNKSKVMSNWYRHWCKVLDGILGISWIWFIVFLYWGIGIFHWTDPLFWWSVTGSLVGWGLWRGEQLLKRIESRISKLKELEAQSRVADSRTQHSDSSDEQGPKLPDKQEQETESTGPSGI